MIKIDNLFELSEKTKDGTLEAIIDLNIVSLNEKEGIKKMLSDGVIVDIDFVYHKESSSAFDENLVDYCMMLLKMKSNQYALVYIESSYWFHPDFAPNWSDESMVLQFAIIPDEVVRDIEVTK